MPDVTPMAGVCPPYSPSALYEMYHNSQASLPWYALFIRQRERERCEDYLLAHSYEYFSPTRTEVRHWSDRKKVVKSPLFPGYLFCRFPPRTSGAILRAPGVIEIVSGGDRYLEVDATQIDSVRRCIETGARLDVAPALNYGQKVRITSGPLSGIIGVLTIFKQQLRVGLEISMMNRTVLVEVDSTQLVSL